MCLRCACYLVPVFYASDLALALPRLLKRIIVLSRAPDGPGRVNNQAELGPLRVLVDRIAAGDAGEAALRGQRQALEIDEARRLVDAPPEVVRVFQDRRLGRHQPQ